MSNGCCIRWTWYLTCFPVMEEGRVGNGAFPQADQLAVPSFALATITTSCARRQESGGRVGWSFRAASWSAVRP